MAKAFKFKYEQYLKLKKKVEEDKAIIFSKSAEILREDEGKLEEFKNLKSETLIHKDDETTISLHRLTISFDYVNMLSQNIEKQIKTIKSNRKINDQDRDILNVAIKEKKIIDKLKENQLTEHRHKQNKKETMINNELGIRMAVKASISGGKL